MVQVLKGNIVQAPALGHYSGQLVHRLIKANQGQVLVQCLDVEKLMSILRRPAEAAARALPDDAAAGVADTTPAHRLAA